MKTLEAVASADVGGAVTEAVLGDVLGAEFEAALVELEEFAVQTKLECVIGLVTVELMTFVVVAVVQVMSTPLVFPTADPFGKNVTHCR